MYNIKAICLVMIGLLFIVNPLYAGDKEKAVISTTTGFLLGTIAGTIVGWGIAGDGETSKARAFMATGVAYGMIAIGTDLGAKKGTKGTGISRVIVRNTTLASALVSGGISYMIDKRVNPYRKYVISYKNGKKIVTDEDGKIIKLHTLHWYLVPIGIISGAYIGANISF